MKINDENLDANILDLQRLASQVLELKNKYRQRRPIVIEFCGSPKSGKTSSINSLNIFLKRNNFKTAVLSERASICPISNKQSPVFNVWTTSSTINELNEIMDRAHSHEDVDIIIADRGIFDALCWFEWLLRQNKMDNDEYTILSKYAMLHRWQKNIDLVYIFTTTPEKSIEREYATLLTKKRGSIMNERILSQYLTSIESAKSKHEKEFRVVETIDTTDKTQNEVGFEVTKKTLETLMSMLVENIGFFPVNTLHLNPGFNDFVQLESSFSNLDFGPRTSIDGDDLAIQPIPIAVITNEEENKILCIKKTEKSTSKLSPEMGKLLLYAGGHMRKEDLISNKPFLKTALNTLERELNEELGLSISMEGARNPFILYCPNTRSSKRHLALGWFIKVDESIKLQLDNYEIVQKKGTSKSGTFLAFQDLCEKDDFESWSQNILLHYFADKLNPDFRDYLKSQPEQIMLE